MGRTFRKRGRLLVAAAIAAAVLPLQAQLAQGQCVLVDQARSISIGDSIGSQSDSTSAGGSYLNAFSNSGSLESEVFAAANQASSILTSGFSATGTCACQPGVVTTASAESQSLFNADFTVTSPRPFNLTGQISAAQYSGLTRTIDTLSVYITVKANGLTLYSASDYSYDGENYYANNTASYSMTLEPGVSYQLSAGAISLSDERGSGTGAPRTSFQFTATVPEPALGFSLPMIGWLLRRKRRSNTAGAETSLKEMSVGSESA